MPPVIPLVRSGCVSNFVVYHCKKRWNVVVVVVVVEEEEEEEEVKVEEVVDCIRRFPVSPTKTNFFRKAVVPTDGLRVVHIISVMVFVFQVESNPYILSFLWVLAFFLHLNHTIADFVRTNEDI
jgi:hypothetical protein